jgi:hypothetical protein
MCKKKGKNGAYLEPVGFHAFQHLGGYKSAIWDYYSNMNVKVTEDNLKISKQLFEGYVRMIAKLKKDGVMLIVEGHLKVTSSWLQRLYNSVGTTIWLYFSIYIYYYAGI